MLRDKKLSCQPGTDVRATTLAHHYSIFCWGASRILEVRRNSSRMHKHKSYGLMLTEIKAYSIDCNSNVGCSQPLCVHFLPLFESHLHIDDSFADGTDNQDWDSRVSGLATNLPRDRALNLLTSLYFKNKYLLLHVVPTHLNVSWISSCLLLFRPLQNVFWNLRLQRSIKMLSYT